MPPPQSSPKTETAPKGGLDPTGEAIGEVRALYYAAGWTANGPLDGYR